MKANIHYASGYHESQPYIQAFWNIVENMDPVDQVCVALKCTVFYSRSSLNNMKSIVSCPVRLVHFQLFLCVMYWLSIYSVLCVF